MIYATYGTLEDRISQWWDARGCPPDADLMDYVPRQSAETLEAWRSWLRAEATSWETSANEVRVWIEILGKDGVSDDAKARLKEADASVDDCRMMLAATTSKDDDHE